jgi:hypothetical protein
MKIANFVPKYAKGLMLPFNFIYTGFSDKYNYFCYTTKINNEELHRNILIPKSKFKHGTPQTGTYRAVFKNQLKEYNGNTYYDWNYRFVSPAEGKDYDIVLKAYVQDVLVQFNHGNAHTFSHFWKGANNIDIERFYKLAQRFGFCITSYKPSFKDGRSTNLALYTDDGSVALTTQTYYEDQIIEDAPDVVDYVMEYVEHENSD